MTGYIKHAGKISFVTRHYCKLDPLALKRELPGVAPFAPIYKKVFYAFKKWTVASQWNPKYNTYFRSKCALFKERRRQLRNKKFKSIIHPLSRFAMFRTIFMAIMWITAFILDPFFSAFHSHYIKNTDTLIFDSVRLFLNSVFVIDVILQFFIGFTIDRTKEIVLDHQRILKHYLSTYFFYDVIPSVYNVVLFTLKRKVVREFLHLPGDIHIWLSIPQIYAFRFVRLLTVSEFFHETLTFFRVRESLVKCMTIALVVAIIIHWWTCFLYIIPVTCYFLGYPFSHSWILRSTLGSKRSVGNIYTECLLCTVCHFFGAGKGNIVTFNPIEQQILSMILMSGIACNIYVIAVILQLFGTINVSETKYEELIYQLNEYIITKKLPPTLKKRLLMYYEYRFQKQFFLENMILNSLSEHLRFEVVLYGCRNLINKVKLFQGAPKEVVGALVSMLRHEIFLPNDSIIKPESMNENVYFISFGTVAVYLENGKEIYHLEDGHHFGEVQVVLQGVTKEYKPIIVAIEITEVFYLDQRDFWNVVAVNPEIADFLEKSALSKYALFKAKLSESSDNILDTSDIIMELRKGRILDQGPRRK